MSYENESPRKNIVDFSKFQGVVSGKRKYNKKTKNQVIESKLFEMVKLPFQGVKWPPTRG